MVLKNTKSLKNQQSWMFWRLIVFHENYVGNNASVEEYSLKIRVGQGFDVHPFCENKSLKLGGNVVDHPFGLKGF